MKNIKEMVVGKDNTAGVPGEDISGKTHLLEMGANTMQNFAHLKSIHLHVCGFHFYSGNMGR
jgi:hypothetical protein